ncbi:CD1845 family protein [Pseudoramibacter alactolyticus]
MSLIQLVTLYNKDITTGIQMLVIGFLVSPHGLPIVVIVAVEFIEGINDKIKQN